MIENLEASEYMYMYNKHFRQFKGSFEPAPWAGRSSTESTSHKSARK